MKPAAGQGRFWVSVHYKCCNVYQRVYFKKGERATRGRCPGCLKEIKFELSEDGEAGRIFSADLERD